MTAVRVAGWRFAGVELDLVRGRLLVDGAEVPSSPLPQKLLELLCSAGGALLTRQQLFDGVWPRQEVSDDALSKLISRLRELLGPYADVLVTVRKQGLRLDAPIEALPWIDTVPAAGAPGDVAPSLPPGAVVLPRWRRWVLLALVLLAALSAGVWQWQSRTAPTLPPPLPAPVATEDPLIHAGYALRASDIGAGRPDTLELVRAAEQAWHDSDPRRAQELLRVASDSDPGCALPPALLSDLLSASDAAAAKRWMATAQQRMDVGGGTPYARLLLRYIAADSEVPIDERAAVDALLTLRPQAWRLQLRRAHIHIQQQDAERALAALQSIPVVEPPPNVLMYVLADRASYGDDVAVAAALEAGALASAPLQRDYVWGRLAWSRGEPDAMARFDRLADAATRDGSQALTAQAHLMGAALAYLADAPDAQPRLRRAAFELREQSRGRHAIDPLALAAELAVRQQHPEEARQLLLQTLELEPDPRGRVEIEILNARLGHLWPPGTFAEMPELTDPRFEFGEPALLAAWRTFVRGERGEARRLLAAARDSGILASVHRQSAWLLAAELATPTAPAPPRDCRIDPPYPELMRISACKALRELAASH